MGEDAPEMCVCVGGRDRRKGAVEGGRMGEGAGEGGAWVGCAGGRFAGCFTSVRTSRLRLLRVFIVHLNTCCSLLVSTH